MWENLFAFFTKENNALFKMPPLLIRKRNVDLASTSNANLSQGSVAHNAQANHSGFW